MINIQISCKDLKIRNCEHTIARLLSQKFSEQKIPALIAVGGPGGTGKSSFCKRLQTKLKACSILTLDDYKFPRKVRQKSGLFGAHPDANDCALVRTHLAALRNGHSIDKPVYDSVTGTTAQTETFRPRSIILLDGEISTYEQWRDLVDFSIFIDSDWRTQLATRITRDIDIRRYTPQKAIRTFLQSNIEEFGEFGKQSKTWADVVLYCRNDYCLQIESVSESLKPLLKESVYAPLTDLTGMVVAVPTPFDHEGNVDQHHFLKHLDFLKEHGISKILINGTTGEFFSLDSQERADLARTARKNWNGFLCIQTGGAGLGSTLEQIQSAQDSGADALLVPPPFYVPDIPADELIEYFTQIRKSCTIPLILYNHHFTKNILTSDVLSSVEHFALKDSTGDFPLMDSTPRYFTGKDRLIRESIQKGAKGFVSGYAGILPEYYKEFESALTKDDLEEITSKQDKILHISELFSGPQQISAIKYALSRTVPGYPKHVRTPLPRCDTRKARDIDAFLLHFNS
ncbi:MAG: dihydrodipicolinate synthase family protein [Chitinispirillaceae bacterium]